MARNATVACSVTALSTRVARFHKVRHSHRALPKSAVSTPAVSANQRYRAFSFLVQCEIRAISAWPRVVWCSVRTVPSFVLDRMKAQSSWAKADNMVSIAEAVGVLVLAQGSDRDSNVAPLASISCTMLRRSRDDLARRSMRVTARTSPWSRAAIGRSGAATTRRPENRLRVQPQEHQHSAVKRDAGPTAATRPAKNGTRARISDSDAAGGCVHECLRRGVNILCVRDCHPRGRRQQSGSGRSLKPGPQGHAPKSTADCVKRA